MRKFCVEIQFNGKNYYGFQFLSGKKTIQGELEKALFKLFGQEISINGCGRTDAGVSAESYYFDFSADTKLPTNRIPFKLNRFLPKDIQAQSAKEVDAKFNARYSAKSKTYAYRFYISKHIMPLYNPTRYRIEKQLDFSAMQSAAELFIGKHDFNAFKTPCKDGVSTVRNIFKIDIVKSGNTFDVNFCGDGFLYNQIRIMAGAVISVGLNEMSLEEIKVLLSSMKNRSDNKAVTLPPNALVLKGVEY